MRRLLTVLTCWLDLFREPHAWFVLGMLALGGFLHYVDVIFPHLEITFPLASHRSSMERVLFLLPVAYSGFIYGLSAGLFTLSVAALVMAPHSLYFEPTPTGGLVETAAVTLVGGLVLLWFDSQRKEKQQRHEALSQLEAARQELSGHIEVIRKNQRQLLAIHEVCRVTTQSLDPSNTMRYIIETTTGALGVENTVVFLAGKHGALELAGKHGIGGESGLTQEYVDEAEALCRDVVASGEHRLAVHPPGIEQAAARRQERALHQLAVPLKSKGQIIGGLCVSTHDREFVAEEIELLSAIGSQAGVSMENAQLYAQTQESEKNYRGLFENASAPMFIHDVFGRITATNNAFIELTGYDRTELLGMHVDMLRSPATARASQEAENCLLQGEEIEQPYEMRILRKDRSERLLSISSRLTYKEGLPAAFEHVARDVTEQEQMRASLEYYLREILTAQEEERTRIARELHDETAQELLVICQRLDSLMTEPNSGLSQPAKASLDEIRNSALQALSEIRCMAQDLRPHVLDTLGLVPAIDWLAEDLDKQCAIHARVEIKGQHRPLSLENELLTFRIVQEAVRNIRRHSGASHSRIVLDFTDSRIRISVEDDGVGFVMPERLSYLALQGKLGLVGMQERARLLGGSISVMSQPGHGTTVIAELPF